MSNHAGSYLLAEVLQMLRRNGVFDQLGPEKSQQLVLEIANRARRHYDCNPLEILEEEGARLGICRGCLAVREDLDNGLCPKCKM